MHALGTGRKVHSCARARANCAAMGAGKGGGTGYLDEIFDARVLVHVDDSFHPDERLDLRMRVVG